jgi:hypothetical protein
MNLDLQLIKDICELLSYVVILIGVPGGLFQYYRTVKKEQQDREYGTYNALDEKYLDFQQLCLEHPYLDAFDIPNRTLKRLSEQEKKQELIAFTMLFSIFERAYLMYHDQSTAIKNRQWSGWEDYIEGYCKRENFRRAWDISGTTFDNDFQDYMKVSLSKSEKVPVSHHNKS